MAEKIRLDRLPEWEKQGGPICGFTGRPGGVSPYPRKALNLGLAIGDDPANVKENYARLGRELDFWPGNLALIKQVHGDRVIVRRTKEDIRLIEADGQVTDAAGLVLGVQVADCVPVLMYDPVAGAVGSVHAGWRGTHLGIIAGAVETLFREYGSSPKNIRVALGPSIRVESYEVGEEIAEKFIDKFGEASGVVCNDLGQKPHLDLIAANRLVALDAGILSEHLTVCGGCTAANPEKYFSYRTDRGQTGRQLGFIGLR